MRLIFSAEAWDDDFYWQQHDRKLLQRINRLIAEIQRDPFRGIGKPEPLRHALAGYWSRRLDDEHRIVSSIDQTSLRIAQLRHHD